MSHNEDDEEASCACARFQSGMQAALRPGYWIPGLRNLHAKEEIWDIETNPDDAFSNMANIVQRFTKEHEWHIRKMDKEKRFIQLFIYSKMNFLDVMEIQLRQQEEWTLARLLCFIPFSDWGENQKRIELLRAASDASLAVFDS